MRRFVVLALLVSPLAACELQPGPPRREVQPAPSSPSTEAPSAPTPAAAVIEAAPADAGAAPAVPDAKPKIAVTQQCIDVGVHVADVLINSADPAQRAVFATERERIVRSAAEACTTQQWSDAAAKCYLATQTQADVKACEAKFTPPRPRTPTGPTPPPNKAPDQPEKTTGAGSAAKTD
jgi:hypothetical protein